MEMNPQLDQKNSAVKIGMISVFCILLVAGGWFIGSMQNGGAHNAKPVRAAKIQNGDSAPVEVKDFQDWRFECISVGGEGQKKCRLFQRHLIGEGQKAVPILTTNVTTVYGQAKDGGQDVIVAVPLMQFIAPQGVLLPAGLTVKIGKEEPGRIAFQSCIKNTCAAELRPGKKLIEQMSANDKMEVTFVIMGPKGPQPVNVTVSLKGYQEGFKALASEMAVKQPVQQPAKK